MAISIAGFVILLLVFAFLKFVVSVIFSLDDVKNQQNNHLAPQDEQSYAPVGAKESENVIARRERRSNLKSEIPRYARNNSLGVFSDEKELVSRVQEVLSSKKETVARIKWRFVYIKFLTSYWVELWVIHFKQNFLELINLIRTNNKIFELNVERKVSSLKNSVSSSINKKEAQIIFAKERLIKSPARTIFAGFLLSLRNPENRIKPKKKAKQNF